MDPPPRLLYNVWGNFTADTNGTDFDSNLVPPEDVSVSTVLTSIYLNGIVFFSLMVSYECLRRCLPTVYSSRKRMRHTKHNRIERPLQREDSTSESRPPLYPTSVKSDDPNASHISSSSLPDDKPLDWVMPVFGIPWTKVRNSAGLDG
jgi:hypothetical protein